MKSAASVVTRCASRAPGEQAQLALLQDVEDFPMPFGREKDERKLPWYGEFLFDKLVGMLTLIEGIQEMRCARRGFPISVSGLSR